MGIFNERLRDLRLETGLTQKEFAANIGISSAAYSLYEKGDRHPRFEIIERICDIYKVTGDWLLGLSNENIKDSKWNFESLLGSIGYVLIKDDPEHKEFIKTPDGSVYVLEKEDLVKIRDTSTTFIKYIIDDILKNRIKVR